MKGGRCEKHAKEKATYDQHRPNSYQRGYDKRWARCSALYREANPLCVMCLLRGITKAAEAVDHIVPKNSCIELEYDECNWAALCWSCHSLKTAREPRSEWTPNRERVALCGLPGTGKTTWAAKRGVPYFDADDLDIEGRDAVQGARAQWIRQHNQGPCTVIVASVLSASLIAQAIGGMAVHLTRVHAHKELRY